MKDWKLKSFSESIFNILVWLLISFIANLIVLPLFDLEVSYLDSLLIWVIYTIISLIRSYFIRRLFVNWLYEAIFNNKKNKND